MRSSAIERLREPPAGACADDVEETRVVIIFPRRMRRDTEVDLPAPLQEGEPRWLMGPVLTHVDRGIRVEEPVGNPVLRCPACSRMAVCWLPDRARAIQPDGTILACVPAFGGCGAGFREG